MVGSKGNYFSLKRRIKYLIIWLINYSSTPGPSKTKKATKSNDNAGSSSSDDEKGGPIVFKAQIHSTPIDSDTEEIDDNSAQPYGLQRPGPSAVKGQDEITVIQSIPVHRNFSKVKKNQIDAWKAYGDKVRSQLDCVSSGWDSIVSEPVAEPVFEPVPEPVFEPVPEPIFEPIPADSYFKIDMEIEVRNAPAEAVGFFVDELPKLTEQTIPEFPRPNYGLRMFSTTDDLPEKRILSDLHFPWPDSDVEVGGPHKVTKVSIEDEDLFATSEASKGHSEERPGERSGGQSSD